jgi:hypothetical protein
MTAAREAEMCFKIRSMKHMSVYVALNKYVAWKQSHSCTARNDAVSQYDTEKQRSNILKGKNMPKLFTSSS